MAKKYGINFPISESTVGDFFGMSTTPEKEVKSNLLHLILTRKGSRYYMPDFGTRLYEFIFGMNDRVTYEDIETDIRDSVKKYIPNVEVNDILIKSGEDIEEPEDIDYQNNDEDDSDIYRVISDMEKPYTAKVTMKYTINSGSFSTSEIIIVNI